MILFNLIDLIAVLIS